MKTWNYTLAGIAGLLLLACETKTPVNDVAVPAVDTTPKQVVKEEPEQKFAPLKTYPTTESDNTIPEIVDVRGKIKKIKLTSILCDVHECPIKSTDSWTKNMSTSYFYFNGSMWIDLDSDTSFVVTRNAKGQPVSINQKEYDLDGTDRYRRSIKYDDKDRVTEVETLGYEGSGVTKFNYDSAGNLSSSIQEWYEHGLWMIIEVYTIKESDQFGNWTRRSVKRIEKVFEVEEGGALSKPQESEDKLTFRIEEREIIYR